MSVLVTRPSPGAERTARRIEALGRRAIVAPLLVIRGTGVPVPDGPFDALLVTSAQAAPFMTGLPRERPCFAVGARTADALFEVGFLRVRTGPGDAAGLAELVADALAPDARLLHVAGRDRKAEPEASLSRLGFSVAPWEAYEAAPVAHLPDAAREGLSGHTVDTIVHFSRRTATLMLALADGEGLGPSLGSIGHLCLSDDVAAPLREAGLNAQVAARPDEDALLALLEPSPAREPGGA